MNQDEVSQLARTLVSEIVPDLEQKTRLIFKDQHGEPILVVTAGSSVLHLNPQTWAEKIILEHVRNATFRHEQTGGDVDVAAQSRVILQDSKKDLIRLLCTVNLLLGHSLWIMEQLSHAILVDFDFGPFWRNVQVGVKWSTLLAIDSRLREILRLPEKSLVVSLAERDEMMSGKYDYAITDQQMVSALKQLERFSIKGLARLLAPDKDDFRPSVYDWMKRKKIKREELEDWWRKLRGGVEKSD